MTSSHMRRRLSVPLIVILAGCGSSTATVAVVPVSGQVLLDGAPLPDADVVFSPIKKGKQADAGLPSSGATDAGGKYSLKTSDGKPGAAVGEHRVSISTRRTKPGSDNPDTVVEAAPEKVPAKYNVNSTLTFTVPPAGSDKADFSLTSQ